MDIRVWEVGAKGRLNVRYLKSEETDGQTDTQTDISIYIKHLLYQHGLCGTNIQNIQNVQNQFLLILRFTCQREKTFLPLLW